MEGTGKLGWLSSMLAECRASAGQPEKAARNRDYSVGRAFWTQCHRCAAANLFQDWFGAERGWPKKFSDNTTARLETVRGSISSSAGNKHFPFNPKGKFRDAESWSAFSAALNVSLAYMLHDKTKIRF